MTNWVTAFEEQLERLGCDCKAAGPVDCIVVASVGEDFPHLPDTLVFADDAYWLGIHENQQGILDRLKALPNNAGTARVWGTLAEFEEF